MKLCSKWYNKIDHLHLIVVPRLRGGWQHNYSTKTRQAGSTNEQPIYSLMSMVTLGAKTSSVTVVHSGRLRFHPDNSTNYANVNTSLGVPRRNGSDARPTRRSGLRNQNPSKANDPQARVQSEQRRPKNSRLATLLEMPRKRRSGRRFVSKVEKSGKRRRSFLSDGRKKSENYVQQQSDQRLRFESG